MRTIIELPAHEFCDLVTWLEKHAAVRPTIIANELQAAYLSRSAALYYTDTYGVQYTVKTEPTEPKPPLEYALYQLEHGEVLTVIIVPGYSGPTTLIHE